MTFRLCIYYIYFFAVGVSYHLSFLVILPNYIFSFSETKQVDFEEVKDLKGIKVSVKSKETDKTDVSVKSKETDKTEVLENNSASPFTFNFPPPEQE